MTTPQDVLLIAARQIGTVESPANSNMNKYGRWYGMDGVEWCAIFVSYCFYDAKLPLSITIPKGFAYCPSGVDWFKANGQWFNTPQVGDVVFYDWYPNTSDSDAWHVGIVESINADGSIMAIEGNTAVGNDSDGGQVMRRRRDEPFLLGFGRPAYNSVSTVTKLVFPGWAGVYITLTSGLTTSNDVLKWQQQMISRGWNLGAGGSTGKGDTGVFDKRCYEVLKKFQHQIGLEEDGVLGPLSWNAAWEELVT